METVEEMQLVQSNLAMELGNLTTHTVVNPTESSPPPEWIKKQGQAAVIRALMRRGM